MAGTGRRDNMHLLAPAQERLAQDHQYRRAAVIDRKLLLRARIARMY